MWTEETVEQLIMLYKQHPLLWDTKDKNYKNRIRKDQSLKEISQAMNLEVVEVERKLNVLNTQFRRTHKKVTKMRESGMPSDEIENNICSGLVASTSRYRRIRGETMRIRASSRWARRVKGKGKQYVFCDDRVERGMVPMMDVEKLIREVKKRRAIWDQKDGRSRRREVKTRHWKEIAKICQATPDAVKAKWKNLRDCFRAEYKKNGKLRPNNTEYVPTWLWYNNLLFLKDQVIIKPKKNDVLPGIMKIEYGESQLMHYDIPSEANNLIDENTIQIDVNAPPVLEQQETYATVDTTDKDRLNVIDNNFEHLENRIKLVEANASTSKMPDDDSYHFLMSIHKPLNNLSIERQMFIRYKIQELIYNAMSNSTNP